VNYRVVLAHEAEKILDRLDLPTEQRIRTRIIQLAEDPFDARLSAPCEPDWLRPAPMPSNVQFTLSIDGNSQDPQLAPDARWAA
jgi:hypothetical protein